MTGNGDFRLILILPGNKFCLQITSFIRLLTHDYVFVY